MGIREWGLVFAWDFKVIFLCVPNFWFVGLRKFFFLVFRPYRYYRKMCRLFPCNLFWRSLFFYKRYHGMRVQIFTMIPVLDGCIIHFLLNVALCLYCDSVIIFWLRMLSKWYQFFKNYIFLKFMILKLFWMPILWKPKKIIKLPSSNYHLV